MDYYNVKIVFKYKYKLKNNNLKLEEKEIFKVLL